MNHLLRRPGFVVSVILAIFITGYLISRRPIQFSRLPSPSTATSSPKPRLLDRPTITYSDYEPPPFPGLDAEELAAFEEKVAQLPEVREFLKKVGERGLVRYYYYDEPNDSYIVGVYEELPDYQATFGLYSVSKSTGKITKQFNP